MFAGEWHGTRVGVVEVVGFNFTGSNPGGPALKATARVLGRSTMK